MHAQPEHERDYQEEERRENIPKSGKDRESTRECNAAEREGTEGETKGWQLDKDNESECQCEIVGLMDRKTLFVPQNESTSQLKSIYCIELRNHLCRP